MDPFKKSSVIRRDPVALVLAIGALLLAVYSVWYTTTTRRSAESPTNKVPTLLAKLGKEKVLHAAYGVTPPYSLEDPNTRKVSGFTVDVIERIAKDLQVRVEWHRLNWNTFIPDLQRGEFDMIGEPIFMTIPRSREMSFSEPIDYFADGVVVVRKDDNRFSTFEDLDKPGTKIAVQMGFASETIARARLPKAEIISIPPGTDQLQLFNEVASGRVDATVSEGGHAQRFEKEHPEVVKIVNLSNPAAWVPGAFAFRFDDRDSARVVSVCLQYLRLNGELAALRKKWGLPERALPQ